MMPKSVKPFASGIVTFSPNHTRFTLPTEVRRSVGWDDLIEGEVLIAEFVDVGHYRLHRRASVEKRIRAEEERIRTEAQSPEQEEEWRQVLADKFREATFYPSDNDRVRVKPEIVMALTVGTPSEETSKLYIQAGKNSIDVMSHSVRIARLKALVQSNLA